MVLCLILQWVYIFSPQVHVDGDKLLPSKLDGGGHHDGHLQLPPLLYIHERQAS